MWVTSSGSTWIGQWSFSGPAIGAFHVAQLDQDVVVGFGFVDEVVALDAVVLNGAGFDLEELVRQLGVAGHIDVAGAGDSVGIHLRGTDGRLLALGSAGVEQRIVLACGGTPWRPIRAGWLPVGRCRRRRGLRRRGRGR